MMMRWRKHSEKGVTGRQKARQMENTIHRTAWSQLKIHVATKTVTLWNSHTVKQSMATWLLSHPTMAHIELSKGSDLKPSSLPLRCHWKLNCQVCHLCYHTIHIRTNIYCSVIFPVLLPINIENPHNWWKLVYLWYQFLSLLNSQYRISECAAHPCEWAILGDQVPSL